MRRCKLTCLCALRSHSDFSPGGVPVFACGPPLDDAIGSETLPDGVEMVMPGDNITMEVKLITPIAMEKTMRFAIREGGRTVGAGRVTEITN